MTYTEIAAQLEADFNRPDKTGFSSQWINDVYKDIYSRKRWTWTQVVTDTTLVANTYEYGLPSDFSNIIDLVFKNGTSDSWRLNLYTPEEFDTLHPNVTEDTAGRPEEGTIVTSSDATYTPFSFLRIWPKPDLSTYTFTMRYEVDPPVLSASLVPIIPVKYHRAIVFGALALAFAVVREYEASVYWEKRFETLLSVMNAEDDYTPNRQRTMQPFGGAFNLYPNEYWKKYEVRGVR